MQALAIGQDWPWQTMVFTTHALLQLGNALAVRSETQSILRLRFRTNMALTAAVAGTLVVQLALVYVPVLQPIFAAEPLSCSSRSSSSRRPPASPPWRSRSWRAGGRQARVARFGRQPADAPRARTGRLVR